MGRKADELESAWCFKGAQGTRKSWTFYKNLNKTIHMKDLINMNEAISLPISPRERERKKT